MGSQVIKVLRQGVWGSLTGGWYYDTRHSKFTNTFHLYTWLILMCLPFIFYTVPILIPQWGVVGTYAATIFTIFAAIKIINYRMHSIFDEGNPIDRKVVQSENNNEAVVVDQIVSEENPITTDPNQVEIDAAFGDGENGRRTGDQGAVGEPGAAVIVNVLGRTASDPGGSKSTDRPVTKRDLEVDVHVDSLNDALTVRNNNETEPTKDAKKPPKKRKHRQRSRPGEKAVAFAAEPEKKMNIGRCASLQSTSSYSDKLDTDEDDDTSTVSDSSTDSEDNTTETSEDTEPAKEIPSEATNRPRAHPMRRRAIRGYRKHPWYQRPNTRPKARLGDVAGLREDSSQSSEGDDWSKVTDNNNLEKSSKKEFGQSGTSKSRKRTPEGRSTLSPQRKLPALDFGARTSGEITPGVTIEIDNPSMQATPDREYERENPTSDQELLAKDPVWRACRSPRYSSDRRLFFRRRSYTINSTRPRERDNRRRLSTVPPYTGRRISPPRRTPSSLQKLLNLWTRDQSSGVSQTGTYSPGQVSPGEVPVVLTGHTGSDSTEFQALSNMFFPPEDIAIPRKDPSSSDAHSEQLLRPPIGDEGSRPKSDSGSHNSNPHCNEVLGANSIKTDGGGDNEIRSNAAKSSTKLKKIRPQTPKRSDVDSSKDRGSRPTDLQALGENYKELQGFRLAVAKVPTNSTERENGQLRIPPESPEEDFDEEEFVKTLINDSEAWQGLDYTAGEMPVADPETGASMPAQSRRRASEETTRTKRDGHAIEKAALDMIADDLFPVQEVIDPRRPRHSFPASTDSTSKIQQLVLPHTSVPGPGRTRNSSGRRVRHPAGSSNSHLRLSSNASEEGGAAAPATLQQTSGNSITSTTELLTKTSEETDLPTEVIQKLEEVEEGPGVHIATEHDDTTAGATHAFQDEHGNWFTYTFGESSGTAQVLSATGPSSRRSSRARTRLRTHSSLQSGDTSDEPKSPQTSRRERRRIQLPSFRRFNQQRQGAGMDISTFLESDMSGSFTQAEWPEMTPIDFILNNAIAPAQQPPTPRVKLYYEFKLFPFLKSITMQYDRLALLDLLDRNRIALENIFATILAIIVAILGLVLLQKGFFQDIWPLWFCAVIATAHYSLLRSVQPDSASPTHGHNRVIAYSRPIYFCVLALLILLFDFLASDAVSVPDSYVYAGIYFTKASCAFATNVLIVLIMILPFFFLLGLLPQINTFVMYLAEQIEIHMFGGTACTGLISALYSLSRSILFCMLLFGFCYGGMKTEDSSQHILFSVFCGLLISFAFHLSRQTNDPMHLWKIVRAKFFHHSNTPEILNAENGTDDAEEDNPDELSSIYVQNALTKRLQSDIIVCPCIAVIMFAIHCSTIFSVAQPALSTVLYIIAGVVGFLTHYVLPQLRKQLPWLVFSSPILKTGEYDLFEVQEAAQVMWFEKAYVLICFVERNAIFPIVIMNELTRDAPDVIKNYGLVWGCIILTFIGLKLLRSAYSITSSQYAILLFAVLYTNYDARGGKDPTIITYFLVSILFVKLQDLLLKLQFVYVYIAPWQITWGSAFHAFAQPFSVPHSGMLLLHTTISSLLHAPLAPFLGSAVFLTSYVRPLKFWERNYNTKRVDHSNTRLASQIDRGPSTDDNNLNSIFYEHLTLSLQKSLCGDISMGRWGNVHPGDCFIMTSDYLNALVHVIQIGNGAITFQLRGLEFTGTYCQQREVEAISESVEDRKCCCCSPGHPENMLSFNAAFSQRWLAWQVHTTKFVLDGYSITDNSATSMLGVYDLRKILLSYMVKSVIYFLTAHESLEKWLNDEAIVEAMQKCEVQDYVDVDTSFSVTIHDDYDMWLAGISRTKFHAVYGLWITHCASRREKPIDADAESKLVTLCFMISVLSRRALGTASSHLTASHVVLESFLYGLHSLFKGDFRITSTKDEWVFSDADNDILRNVIVPGVRMSLKLHQDHFQNTEDEEDLDALYNVITENVKEMVITHEADPQWRIAVLSSRSSLLALRHVSGDAVDTYFVITLKRRSQGFRVVRVNKECVQGLWAGQQQELVFLRNSNPERGSIQNAKQVLRNMINSSCDQPIGYPIYVSPITTSFDNTHSQLVGWSISTQGLRRCFSGLWAWIQQSCGGGCNSGGSAGIHIRTDHGVTRRPPAPIPGGVQAPPASVRTSVAGSQSSGSHSNVPEGSEQISVNRMLRVQPHRSLSYESRRVGRPNADENVCGNVFMSSSSLSGRPPSRWRMGPDGTKIPGSRHASVTGSMEMSNINPKYFLQSSLSSRTSRNSRREGTESPANSDTTVVMKFSVSSLPNEENKSVQASLSASNGSGRIQKSSGMLAAPSSSSSSISKGDSLTVVNGQLVPPPKPARKSSGDGAGIDVKASGRTSSKSKKDSRNKKTKNKSEQQESAETEKEMLTITDPSRVFETLEVHRQTDYVKWPNAEWRKRGGRSKWGKWNPKEGMVGEAVFRWYPNHRNPSLRAHVGEVIVLLRIEDASSKEPFYVPIPEKCTSKSNKAEIETTQL